LILQLRTSHEGESSSLPAGGGRGLRLRALNNRLLFRDLFRKLCESPGQPEPASRDLVATMKAAPAGWYAGKVGTTELLALEFAHRWLRPSFPPSASWRRPAYRLFIDSGVFPVKKPQFEEFIRVYLEALRQADGLYLWQKDPFLRDFETTLASKYAKGAVPITGHDLCYQMVHRIADLRWLVVSPFVKTMKAQLSRLDLIHGVPRKNDPFGFVQKTCRFLQCPHLASLENSPYKNWSEGLTVLSKKALAEDFDICIVGAGAWSLPLLKIIKENGRKGLHLGGETQLMFGIKGTRWDTNGIYNEWWIRPLPEETPSSYRKKERGCYW